MKISAEQGLLGLCLNYPEYVKEVSVQIPLHYYAIQEPWEFMYAEAKGGRKPSLTVIISEVGYEKYLDRCADLFNPPNTLPSLINGVIEDYRERLRDEILKDSIDGDWGVDKLILELKQVQVIGSIKESSWIDELQSAADNILTAKEGGVNGLRAFGITELDESMNGIEAGDLIIIAARPSMGKSVCCTTIINELSIKQGHRGLLWTLEMTRNQMIERQLATFGNNTYTQISKGRVNEESLLQDVAMLAEVDIKIIEKVGVTVNQICGEIMRQHALKPLKYVLIDHGGWIRLASGKENTSEKKGQISKALKELAKELGIPVIMLWQLSRKVEARGGLKQPMLSDLRDSGELEEDADKVILLWRPDYYGFDTNEDGEHYPVGYGEFDLAKCRGGKVGIVKAVLDMDVVLWREERSNMFPDASAFPKKMINNHDTSLINSKRNSDISVGLL